MNPQSEIRNPTPPQMPLLAALEVLAKLRTDQIVVTTMGSAREWPKLSQHPLDFHYLPSAMGHAPMDQKPKTEAK